MVFDWADYLQFARDVYENTSCCGEEAMVRSAISRAYYGAFCTARNRARDVLHYKPTYDIKDHSGVPRFYDRVGRAPIATKLRNLRDRRNTCDYVDNAAAELAGLRLMLYMALLDADRVLDELPAGDTDRP